MPLHDGRPPTGAAAARHLPTRHLPTINTCPAQLFLRVCRTTHRVCTPVLGARNCMRPHLG
eukprot:198714-Chlamydomonas_euryale.AAC.3